MQKDPYEVKYQWLSNKREGANMQHWNDFEAFIGKLNDMDDIYKRIEEYH